MCTDWGFWIMEENNGKNFAVTEEDDGICNEFLSETKSWVGWPNGGSK